MKKSVIVVVTVAVVLAGIGGYLVYGYWKSTPENALSQIKASFKGNDIMLFREYVDLDTVLDRGVDSLLADMPRGDGDGDWADSLARGLVELIKPTLVAKVEKGIESWIETGQIPGRSAEGEAQGQQADRDLDLGRIGQLKFQGIESKRREGKVCHVTLSLHHDKYGCDLSPELLMRETPRGHLQVVEIANLAELLKTLDEEEAAWKRQQNAPFREKIEAALQVLDYEKSTREDRWGFDQKIVVSLSLRNNSDRVITGFEGTMYLKSMTDAELKRGWPVSSDERIRPGEQVAISWEMDTNQFIKEESSLYDTPGDELEISLVVESLSMEGGESFEMPYRGY